MWALQLKRLKQTSVKYDWKYVGYMPPEDSVSADDWSSYIAGEIRSDSWLNMCFHEKRKINCLEKRALRTFGMAAKMLGQHADHKQAMTSLCQL